MIDSFSEDGSWEFFEELARQDRRVSIAQAPRGMYESWNSCIQRASGKYVYIATSDDSMAPDCLQKLVAALEEHTECDLAHCTLVATDKDGKPIGNGMWADATVFARGIPDLLNQRHVRRAPYDGLLHLTGAMVYLSITELLIRRSLFSKIGGFDPRWGPMGDRNWEMKAGLVANTIHVPDTWATWRTYPTQASSGMSVLSADYARNIEEMILDAVLKCESQLETQVVAGLKEHWLGWSGEMRTYYTGLRNRRSFSKRLFQMSQIFDGGRAARCELMYRLIGRPKWVDRAPGEIRSWLESLGLGPVVGQC